MFSMTLAQLISLTVEVSLGLIVFSVALQAAEGDLVYLLRRPSLLVRSLLAMNVIMPLAAVAGAVSLNLRHEVEVALLLLALSPVPPILPGKQAKAGGNVSYGIGLLFISALLSIVFVPAAVAFIGQLFDRPVTVAPSSIAKAVAISVLAPLVLGAILRRVVPAVTRWAKPISLIGTVLVVVAFIPVLIKSWPAIKAATGDFTVVAIVLFVAVSLVVGHVLGGPDPEDRTILALSTASRHPGVALAVAGVTQDPAMVGAAVLLAFLVSAVATGPYVKWRRRRHDAAGVP